MPPPHWPQQWLVAEGRAPGSAVCCAHQGKTRGLSPREAEEGSCTPGVDQEGQGWRRGEETELGGGGHQCTGVLTNTPAQACVRPG